MKFGVLTGGGDCPGLNAVIRAIVRKATLHHGHEIIGFRDGWRGPLEGDAIELTLDATRGILPRGGTILRSSRTNPFKRDDGVERVKQTFQRHRLDGLIAIGGGGKPRGAAPPPPPHGPPGIAVAPKNRNNPPAP